MSRTNSNWLDDPEIHGLSGRAPVIQLRLRCAFDGEERSRAGPGLDPIDIARSLTKDDLMSAPNRCPNMNHGRMNAPVRYCPMCGGAVNRSAAGSCDQGKHAELLKQRHAFCHDCGKSLAPGRKAN